MNVYLCVNSYGATVYDGLYRNEAELIAKQHGLEVREDPRFKRRLQQIVSDTWYAAEVERMAERAPA